MKKLKVLPSMQCDEGCGDCCGLVPVTETEYRRVERYAKEHDIKPVMYTNGTCPFYQDNKCSVYPVRPVICQVFGHSMQLKCTRGYNVNVDERQVERMVTARGPVVKTLHDMIPGFVEEATEFAARERAKNFLLLAGGKDPDRAFQELVEEAREELEGRK